MIPTEELERLEDLVDRASVVYLATIDDDGFPCCKAMLAPRLREGLVRFYLTTNTSSRRVAQLRVRPQAALYFCDEERFRGVQFTGSVEVCEEARTKELVWREGDDEYYPGGVADPDYCVLRFTARRARRYADYRSVDIDL